MLYKIKTKNLLKLISPSSTGFLYKDKTVKLDESLLDNFLRYPSRLFEYSTAPIDNDVEFTKNLACFIIDSDTNKYITLGLGVNSEFVVDNGIYELLKSIYKGEEEVVISLPSELVLADYRHLKLELQEKKVEAASDDIGVFDGGFSAGGINLWENKSGSVAPDVKDVYDNIDYVLKVLDSIDERFIIQELELVLKKTTENVKNSNEFKLKLMDHSAVRLLCKKGVLDLDFSNPVLLDKLKSETENKRFAWLEYVLSVWINEKNLSGLTLENLKELVNLKETVSFLKERNASFQNTAHREEIKYFDIKYLYELLSDANKEDVLLIKLFIDSAKKKTVSNNIILTNSDLYKIPLHKFNDERVLIELLPYIGSASLKEVFDSHNMESELLSNTKFLLDNAKSFPGNELLWMVKYFVKKEDLSVDLFKQLVAIKTGFYKELKEISEFSEFVSDFEVIKSALTHGVKFSDISAFHMSGNLLRVDDAETELLKLEYVLNRNVRSKRDATWFFSEKKDIDEFEAKYLRLENLFLISNPTTTGVVSKEDVGKYACDKLSLVRSKSDVLRIIGKTGLILNAIGDDKIKFAAKVFYQSLDYKLQLDKDIIYELADLGLRYRHLNEAMKYNKNIVLRFLELDGAGMIENIPEQVFKNDKFALEFSRLLDQNELSAKYIPANVLKFFESGDIKEKFAEAFEKFLTIKKLNSKTEAAGVVRTDVKKKKI